jgi:phosphoribosylformylglycinamidine synthase
VIGGNVSLYNESGGADIDPTPVLGVLGLVDAVRQRPPGLAWSDGDAVVLLGPGAGAPAALAGSRWAAERRGHRGGALPPLDTAAHAAVCAFVADLVATQVGDPAAPRVVRAVHDVSSGGLAVALAEMSAAAGIGCTVDADDPAALFSETPSRFVVATPDGEALCDRARAAGVPAVVLGRAGGQQFVLGDLVDLEVTAVCAATEGSLAEALGDR